MKLFIITGVSRGLGLDLAKRALSDNSYVIGISRSASLKHENYIHLKHDLSKFQGLDKKLDKALDGLNLRSIKAVHVINNAAGIEPIGKFGSFEPDEIGSLISLNLTTPMALTNYVLSRFKNKVLVTNISSGAAVKAISGWGLYCSSKSGLRMFSECLDIEGVKNISFSPGIMDTAMQATLRKQKVKDFSRVNEFKEYKNQNQLLSSDKVAELLMELLNNPERISKVHYSVNELL